MVNWFKELWNKIITSDNQPLIDIIDRLIMEARVKQHSYEVLLEEYASLNEEILTLKEIIADAEDKLNEPDLEEYWNNKIPSQDKLYFPARGRNINVIRFFNEFNDDISVIENKGNDDTANKLLIWVAQNIKYTKDTKEHWQWANETLKRKAGDCEDGAILMACMMLKAGIPYWRVRLNAGNVQGGGHAYVTYLREKDNKWYIMDWCYWTNESFDFKKTWDSAKKYFGIWFSWNNKYGFNKDTLDR